MKYSFDLTEYTPRNRGEGKRTRAEIMEKLKGGSSWVMIGGSFFLLAWWLWLGGGEMVSAKLAKAWFDHFDLFAHPRSK